MGANGESILARRADQTRVWYSLPWIPTIRRLFDPKHTSAEND
jgi:hypothetical protein